MLTLLPKGDSSFLFSSFDTSAAPDGSALPSAPRQKVEPDNLQQYDESACQFVCPWESNSEKLH